MSEPKTKAIIYARFSPRPTSGEATISQQITKCRQAARRRGWDVIGVYKDEGISGASAIAKRPGLIEALRDLPKGGALLVAKRDRLARDTFLMAWIDKEAKRSRCRVVSVAGEGTESDEPGALLMRRLVDAFAEYERAVISARTKAAMRHQQCNGHQVGGRAPYGWESDPDRPGHLRKHPGQQEGLTQIKAWREEKVPYYVIADRLNEQKVPTATGSGRWDMCTVFRIVRRGIEGREPAC